MKVRRKIFTVVARAASAAYFTPDGYFLVRQFPTRTGPVDVLIRTRRAKLEGFDRPVPRGLYAEVRGNAESIYEALQEFTTAAQNLLPFLSVSANAPITNIQPELAFESTPGVEEREFFQQFLLDERLLPYRPRKVHARATKELMHAILKNPAKDRLLRASAQYFHALQEWGPGQEIMALAHIYIGMEVLTPVALRTHLSHYRIDKGDLVEAWKIDLRRLDSEVKRRLLFDCDDDTYSRVKEASDGFEHGFLDFHDIRATALDLREKAAGYLRRALLRLSSLSERMIAELTEHPYTNPFHLDYTKYLWGTLRGKRDILAADGQDYPIMMWRSKPSQKPNTTGPDPEVVFGETITARLAPGIEFHPRRLEIWGAKPDADSAKPPSLETDA